MLDKRRDPGYSISILDQKEKCICVGKHVPLPVRVIPYELSSEEVVYLCPTAIDNLILLQEQYDEHEGPPPGFIRKRFGDYIQELARRTWAGV